MGYKAQGIPLRDRNNPPDYACNNCVLWTNGIDQSCARNFKIGCSKHGFVEPREQCVDQEPEE